jgi:hypothetical protein
MAVDHVGIVFFPENALFRAIGRFSMPLFAYAVARGFHFSLRNQTAGKYFVRMAVCGAAALVPFLSVANAHGSAAFVLDICFTWLLSLCVLRAAAGQGGKRKNIPRLVVVVLLCAAATFFVGFDGGMYAVLCPVVMYCFMFWARKPLVLLLVFSAATVAYAFYASAGMQMIAILAIPVLLSLERREAGVDVMRGTAGRRFFYVFYPAHLAVIAFFGGVLPWQNPSF